MSDSDVNYETMPGGMAMDETDVNLRSYFSRLSDDRLREYDPTWTDDQLMAWDDNFTNEGTLFLVCSERDVDIEEYRRVLIEHMGLRGISRLKRPAS